MGFVWQYKKPRVRFKVLYNSKNQGGLEFPNLQFYYDALLLSKLLKNYSADYTADWKTIEDDGIHPRTLQEIL